MTVNEDLRDAAIRHTILLERFTRREVALILRFLDDKVYPDILREVERIGNRMEGSDFVKLGAVRRRRRLLAMLQDLDSVVRGGTVAFHGELRERLVALSGEEASWQLRTIERVVDPIQLGLRKPGAQLLRSIVTTRPMTGRFLREWSASVGAQTSRNVRQAIQIGLAQGEHTDEIVRRVRGRRINGFRDGVLETSRRSAEAVVRTAVSHVFAHARQAVFEENRDIVDRVQWVSTLDLRTSQICAGLDGRTWPVGSGPRPPAHVNCRSSVVPVLVPAEAVPGFDPSKIPPATRASMNGEVAESVTFGKWLRQQPAATQDMVLGPGKGALFRRGRVPIEKFVDVPALRPLSLAELRRIEDGIVARAGARAAG